MSITAPARPVLEPAAAAFAEATAKPPYPYQMTPAEGRRTLDEVQSGEVPKPEVDEEWISVGGIRRAASRRGSSALRRPSAPFR
ncbi:hypothetical protein GCM10017744_018590 [Streptomyces antimycoticus]